MKKLLKIFLSFCICFGIFLTGCSEDNTDSNKYPPIIMPDEEDKTPEIPDDKPVPPPDEIEIVDFTFALCEVKNYLLDTMVLADDFVITTEANYATITFSIDILFCDVVDAVILWETDIVDGFSATMEYNSTTVIITIKKCE